MSAEPIVPADDPVEELNRLIDYQHRLLERAVQPLGREQILADACRLAESAVPDSLCSVMLLGEDGLMYVAAGPSLPDTVVAALNGLVPVSGRGSCPTAVATGKPVFVTDAATDPAWACARELAARFGIRACWAFPVRGEAGNAIGSIALTSMRVRSPTRYQKRVLEISANVVGMMLVRDAQQSRLEFLALHDEVTRLPNRRFLVDALELRCRGADSQAAAFSVLYVDVDRFKQINDTYGHRVGDDVILETARRLVSVMGPRRLVTRLGGDEFVIVVDGACCDDALADLARSIAAAFSEPVHVDGVDHFLMFSIGISRVPADAARAGDALQCADAAMYDAKRNGRNQFRLYDPSHREHARRLVEVRNGIGPALARGEFRLVFQPKFDTASLRIVGAECLLRWPRADGSLVSPLDFIPQAEELGLIDQITRWVLHGALEQLRAWRALGHDDLTVAVNVSGRELNPAQVDRLCAIVRESAVPNEAVEFEITEGWLIDDDDEVLVQAKRMRDLGLRLAVDDFGLGRSCLHRLKRLPVDTLKIDRSLVQDLPGQNADQVLIRSIVKMAHGLRLATVAEGVEKRCQLDFLRQAGCAQVQGFFLGYPVEAAQFLRRLAEDTAGAGAARNARAGAD